jgi:septal ring factor EnvC (AmiA/AmiB activator)
VTLERGWTGARKEREKQKQKQKQTQNKKTKTKNKNQKTKKPKPKTKNEKIPPTDRMSGTVPRGRRETSKVNAVPAASCVCAEHVSGPAVSCGSSTVIDSTSAPSDAASHM